MVTDHQALTSLLSSGGTGHRPLRLHRWASRLYRYSFKVVYKPGRDNVVADCLSRLYDVTAVPPTSSIVNPNREHAWDDAEAAEICSIFGALGSDVVTLDDVAAATATDASLLAVRRYIVDGWPSSRQQVQPEIRQFFDRRLELSVVQSCITRGFCTVIPAALRQSVLTLAHEGHPGIVRMKRLCRDAVWWPAINTDIEHVVRDSTACIISGKSVKSSPGPLQPLPWPSGPWRRLSLDIAGEYIAAPHHQRFIIVAVDHFSKWPEVGVSGSVTSSVIIDFLTVLFDRFGLIEELITDNGVQFTSDEFQTFLKQHGIRHSRSALYAPQSNGAVERFNRVLKEGIKANMSEGKTFWTSLRQTVANYRATPHTVTGVTPSSLMLAFTVRTPVTMLSSKYVRDKSPSSNRRPSTSSTATQHQQMLPSSSSTSSEKPSRSSLRQKVQFHQDKMKSYHDTRRHAKLPSIVAGDFVRILLPKQLHKLAATFSEPRQVERVNGNWIKLCNGQTWNLRRCIKHRLPLKSARAVGNNPSDNVTQPETEVDSSDNIPSFNFALPPDQTAQGHGQILAPRRSNRIPQQRDFGPVISH